MSRPRTSEAQLRAPTRTHSSASSESLAASEPARPASREPLGPSSGAGPPRARHASFGTLRQGRTALSDKYLIGEELGRGGSAQVFKGIDTRTGENVAIKQLSLSNVSQEHLQGIMGEIELLKNLNHRNIVKYLGSFKTRAYLYIILEFMENGSLASVLKPGKFGAFPETLGAVYIAQVLQGLAYLHEQGVVHRDVKGANILTTKEGVVKLADFGVAARPSEEEGLGEVLSVVGTPYWMSPEVIEMTSVTSAADIWSVGCLVVELLTGQPPYFELQPMTALFRIVQDEHPPLPEGISPPLQNFLLSCFQKDPQRRPGARALLQHPWLAVQRATLRATWSKGFVGLRARVSQRAADVQGSVSAVVERTLQAEGEDGALTDRSAAQSDPGASSDPSRPYADPSRPYGQRGRPPDPAEARAASSAAESKPSTSGRAALAEGRSASEGRLGAGERRDPAAAAAAASGEAAGAKGWPRRVGSAAAVGAAGLGLGAAEARGGGLAAEGRGVGAERGETLDSATELGYQQGGPRHFGQQPRGQLAAAQEAEYATSTASSAELESAPSTSSRLPEHHRGALRRRPSPLDTLLDAREEESREGGQSPPGPEAPPLLSPLTGLLSQLGFSAAPGPPEGAEGQDLLGWLQERESSSAVAVPLSPARGAAAPPGGFEAPQQQSGPLAGHQDAAEVRRYVAALQPLAGPALGSAAAPGPGAVVEACRTLIALFQGRPACRHLFLAEDGAIAIQELLDDRNPKVNLAALELANAAVAGDAAALDAVCLLGLAPPVAEFCQPGHSRHVRYQAALFVHALCTTSPATARMFVACQGLPLVVTLVEEAHHEHGALTQLGVAAVWRLLELHGPAPVPHLCRLLVGAGLALRLLRALATANAELAAALHAAAMSVHSPLKPVLQGVHEADPDIDPAIGRQGTPQGQGLAPSRSIPTPKGRPPGVRSGRPPPAAGKPPGRGRSSSPVPGATPGGAGSRGSPWGTCSADALAEMVDKMSNLLLVLATCGPAVKAHLGQRETLQTLLGVLGAACSADLQLRCLRALKHLSTEPALLQPLQDAGTIPVLHAHLALEQPLAAQGEALAALFHLCTLSRGRQEAAAAAGVIPYLAALAARGPQKDAGALRPLAVQLLCGMAHGTERTRGELLRAHGLDLLLDLLQEPAWQGAALEALAAWLAEDSARVGARLARRDAAARFMALFGGWAGEADSGVLARLLDPFLRILKKTPPLAVELAGNGLANLAVSLLAQASALTALPLLQLVRVLYESHPKPKAFVASYGLPAQLRRLAAGGGDRPGHSVLVRKQATNLLEAFRINSVF